MGRGLRIAVNQLGERQDNPATVHQTNVLTVVASESYKDFVAGLQRDISESLSERPRVADEAYFTGKMIITESGAVEVTPQMAKQIYRYLLKNDYTDDNDNIAQEYHEAIKNETLAPLPDDLKSYKEQVFQLIDSVYSDEKLPQIENDRGAKTNPLNGPCVCVNIDGINYTIPQNQFHIKHEGYKINFKVDTDSSGNITNIIVSTFIRKCIFIIDYDRIAAFNEFLDQFKVKQQ